jgi:hypothetical protein
MYLLPLLLFSLSILCFLSWFQKQRLFIQTEFAALYRKSSEYFSDVTNQILDVV